MQRGATPTHTFTLPFSTEIIQDVSIVYSQNDKVVLRKQICDCNIEANQLSLRLTQEETLVFNENYPVEIQVKVLTMGNDVLVSVPYKARVDKCLCEVVL